jgi:hypothetical protein
VGFIGMIIAPLALLFLPGLVCLILGAFRKARRRRLLIAGCVLCAPLLALVLFTVIGSILMNGGNV